MKKMQRNSFFISDRIIGSVKYDIIYRTPIIVKILKEIKARKRQEKSHLNREKFYQKEATPNEGEWEKNHHNIFKNTSKQIQNGFDIATRSKNMTQQKVEELFVEIETQIKNYREADTLGMRIYWLNKLKDKALYLNSEIQLFLQGK